MYLILSGDNHLTDKTPENRIDDYEETALRKFQFTLDTARNKGVELVIQPGDFFDGSAPSYSLFTKVVKMINDSGLFIATIYGQHDLRYRNKGNTALRALKEACPKLLLELNDTFQDLVYIQSASFEEPVPKPKAGKFNVLIIHKMIVDTKLWEDQEDFVYGNEFLKSNKFDLIVSGDNHKSFYANFGHRWLFNCGSLLRSTIAQTEHEPRLIFFDTIHCNWSEILIPIKPANEVFKMEQVIKAKERDEKLESFVEGLSQHKEMGLSFEDNLNAYMKENEVDPSVQTIIKECMS